MKSINQIFRKLLLVVIPFTLFGLQSCDDEKSYSDLLTEEEHAVNWYLAQNKVVPFVPKDSIFEVGEDAPFYRMNSDGSVYMRIVNRGDMNNRPKKGDTIYFRFTRYNIKYLFEGQETSGESNDQNQDVIQGTTLPIYGGMSLIYGNTILESTTQYGDGIQVPLGYVGYDCEVDLIVKSIEGFSGDISQCYPFVYKSLKFFKAEY